MGRASCCGPWGESSAVAVYLPGGMPVSHTADDLFRVRSTVCVPLKKTLHLRALDPSVANALQVQ